MKLQAAGFLCLALLIGCRTLPPEQVFLSRTGHSRADYAQLYQVSISGLRVQTDEVFKATTMAVKGVRDVALHCTNSCPEVLGRLNYIERTAGRFHEDRLDWLARLASIAEPMKGDSILYYHLLTSNREEDGWVVVRGSRIRAKLVFNERSAQCGIQNSSDE